MTTSIIIIQNIILSFLLFSKKKYHHFYNLRLSAIAGDKLINNNPNIANLQDSKRPTKIAEQYKDLYDNEWTDTMELFEKKFEKSDASVTKFVYHLSSVVKVLYDTLHDAVTVSLIIYF